jgi:CRISPR/Cas system type I-B associated protein Csh2 (Cas7 group RAMP superfamily)
MMAAITGQNMYVVVNTMNNEHTIMYGDVLFRGSINQYRNIAINLL